MEGIVVVKIDSLGFGSIGISGKKYRVWDVLILPDGTVQRRKLGCWLIRHHSLGEKEISDLVAAGAKIVVIGTGKFSRAKLSDSARSYAKQSKIEIVELSSRELVDKFNRLAKSGKKKLGALIHLMC